MSKIFRSLPVLFLALAAVASIGCGGHHEDAAASDTPEAADEGHAASTEAVVVTISDDNIEAVRAVLVEADKLDGSEDGVVEKCSGCALHMDGSADHTITVADHELHFCSDACRKRFEPKAEEALVALDVPNI